MIRPSIFKKINRESRCRIFIVNFMILYGQTVCIDVETFWSTKIFTKNTNKSKQMQIKSLAQTGPSRLFRATWTITASRLLKLLLLREEGEEVKGLDKRLF